MTNAQFIGIFCMLTAIWLTLLGIGMGGGKRK